MGAVYSAPIAGALFAVEIVLATVSIRAGAIALAVSLVADVIARPVTHDATTYPWPGDGMTPMSLLWSIVVIPIALVIGMMFTELTRGAHPQRHRRVALSLPLAGVAVGLVAIPLPAVPGNGKAVVQEILTAHPSVPALLALTVAKPVLTALCLRAGATGGVLTPAMATGAAAGGGLALLAEQNGVAGVSVAVWALLTGAAVLAVSQNAPFFAAVFAWELTRPSPWLLIPLAIATFGSWFPVRSRGGYPPPAPAPRASR